eukprot:CAMPEP_0113944650 /NCGR_PEP_ID=MMETSP1339-20121228/35143_1 /TAXON_ID=94617 /ORGANISM="Fibrocapsa japonica" /LENGTH=300 /DNA_ID=CAMNT_0000949925 /DNA_START=28 /DNA_END=927 /DNA_ORIENTATION=+ /assembly_acc=CAM_ASM_000762
MRAEVIATFLCCLLGCTGCCSGFLLNKSFGNGLSFSNAQTSSSLNLAIDECITQEPNIKEAADFFGRVFFAGGEEMPTELKELVTETWISRYGPTVGKGGRFPGSIFISKDSDQNINGVVVADICLLDMNNKEILPKDDCESLITSKISKFGPKQRREFKGLSLPDLLANLMQESPWKNVETGEDIEFVLAPVLANLAVSSSARGKGIARALCAEVESWSKNWLEKHLDNIQDIAEDSAEASKNVLGEVWLVAEPSNTPAISLYESMGYTERWINEQGSELRLISDEVITETATHRAMSK